LARKRANTQESGGKNKQTPMHDLEAGLGSPMLREVPHVSFPHSRPPTDQSLIAALLRLSADSGVLFTGIPGWACGMAVGVQVVELIWQGGFAARQENDVKFR
jgi:hypothetical protein